MKYGEMTFEEIKDAASKGWMVILPEGLMTLLGELLQLQQQL